jgi:hypothetical protein
VKVRDPSLVVLVAIGVIGVVWGVAARDVAMIVFFAVVGAGLWIAANVG